MTGVLRFITAGSVDDGKSTLIGRLLYDSRQILEDQLAAVEHASRKRGFSEADLSLLTDGLEAEREQGITIDVAYRYFATARRKFIIADTPGHVQYTRNMATGASTAHAAVILADATKGLLEQGRRHLCIAHLLGIRDLVVAVNKMDLVGYERAAFEAVREAFEDFAEGLEGPPPRLSYIPVSALKGDHVVERGARMPWYAGPTLIDLLESIETASGEAALPLRLPVQLVQRLPGRGRTYLGRVAAGTLAAGQRVAILPAGVQTTVKTVYRGAASVASAQTGDAVAFDLTDEVDVARGDVVSDALLLPRCARELAATLIWLAPEPLRARAPYLVKHMTRTTKARVVQIDHEIDVGTLQPVAPAGPIAANSIVRVQLAVQQPLAFDPYSMSRASGAFILIDEATNQTVAAGLIR